MRDDAQISALVALRKASLFVVFISFCTVLTGSLANDSVLDLFDPVKLLTLLVSLSRYSSSLSYRACSCCFFLICISLRRIEVLLWM